MEPTNPAAAPLPEVATAAVAAGVEADPAAPDGEAPPAPAGGVPARTLRLLLFVVGLAALVALLWPRGAGGPTPGGFLVDAAGRPQPLAAQLAPVTLLHFWATWCPPCMSEAPVLERLTQDMAGERRFKVLKVAVADEVAQVEKFAGGKRDGMLFDPNWDIAHRYGTNQLPETYLLVDGKVKRKWIGATDWDDAQIRAAIQRALAEAKGEAG